MTVAEVLQQAQRLSIKERKELVKLVIDTIDEPIPEEIPRKKHSLMELRGLGREIWEGIDAQEYVNQLRDEWDNRP